jgi:hypothetical protein
MLGDTKHSVPSCHKGHSSHTTNITYPLFERFMHSSAEPRSYFYTPGLTLEFILILKVICQRLIEYFLLVIKYNMILIKWQLSIFLIAIDSTIPPKWQSSRAVNQTVSNTIIHKSRIINKSIENGSIDLLFFTKYVINEIIQNSLVIKKIPLRPILTFLI